MSLDHEHHHYHYHYHSCPSTLSSSLSYLFLSSYLVSQIRWSKYFVQEEMPPSSQRHVLHPSTPWRGWKVMIIAIIMSILKRWFFNCVFFLAPVIFFAANQNYFLLLSNLFYFGTERRRMLSADLYKSPPLCVGCPRHLCNPPALKCLNFSWSS